MAADFEQVKQNITDTIYENGEELITGQVMQDRLLEMVSVTEEAINDVTIDPTVNVTVNNTTGTPSGSASFQNNQFSFEFSGIKGEQGNPGSSQDYPFELENSLNGGTSKALTAEQGKVLDGKVTQLGQKVDELAQGKFYGYFSDADELPAGGVPGFAYVGTAAPFAIYNFDGSDWSDSGLTIDEIPIGNGEDIDTDADGKLQFANRVYNAQQPNGMGYKILRKDATFASQVTDANTIYEIRYDFDLGGEEVTIPEGCELSFVGGSIDNGTIVGATSRITGCLVKFIGASLNISGTWNVPRITTSALISPTDDNSLKKLIALTDDSYDNEVVVESGEYAVDAEGQFFAAALWLKSNTKFEVIGTIKLNPSADDYASLVQIYQKENIVITGSGNLIGDRDGHTGTTGEWGHGISIYSGKNIKVNGLSITKCWGDNIYVGSPATDRPASENIVISNCTLSYARRQGISVGAAAFVQINDCYIHHISGTNPKSAIDIEPDGQSFITKNVTIRNVKAEDNASGLVILDLYGGDSIKDITIDNCYFAATSLAALRIRSNNPPSIRNCKFVTSSTDAIVDSIDSGSGVKLESCELVANSHCTHAIKNTSLNSVILKDCTITGEIDYCTSYFYNGSVINSTISAANLYRYGSQGQGVFRDSDFYLNSSIKWVNSLFENNTIRVKAAILEIKAGSDVRFVNNKIIVSADVNYLFYVSGSGSFILVSGNIIDKTGYTISNYHYYGTNTFRFVDNYGLDNAVYTRLPDAPAAQTT